MDKFLNQFITEKRSLSKKEKKNIYIFSDAHYLMRMLKGHMEVELSENEEFTLDYTISQLPEFLIQLHWIASWPEISTGDINV